MYSILIQAHIQTVSCFASLVGGRRTAPFSFFCFFHFLSHNSCIPIKIRHINCCACIKYTVTFLVFDENSYHQEHLSPSFDHAVSLNSFHVQVLADCRVSYSLSLPIVIIILKIYRERAAFFFYFVSIR